MGLYKKGDVWWFIKQHKGRRVEESLGTNKKKLAEKFYADKLPKILDGSYFERPKLIPTMKEVIVRYMREVSPLQKSHERNQEIAPHFYDLFMDCLVSEIKPLLSEYKTKRLLGEIKYGRGEGRQAGESTVKKELSFLRQVFSYAINEWDEDWNGYFKENDANPVKKVIKGLKDRKRVRYILKEEAYKLRKALMESQMGYLKEMVIVGCQTGLREGNIVNLLVSQCDFANSRINKPCTEMKDEDPFSGKMTSIVKETLQDVIRSRKVISPYVFVDEYGKPYTVNAVSMAFGRACRRAKIIDLRFHDLRHDFATLLIDKGASLYQVQVSLSHDDPRMTQRYAQFIPETSM